MKLSYITPASKWIEALPLGNGRLGAMVFGDPCRDTVQINEETLWSGWFDEYADNPETIEHLDEIRQAIFSGDYAKGEALTQKYMVCRGVGSGGSRDGAYGSYQTAGELHVAFPSADSSAVTDYSRELDLRCGLSKVSYKINGVRFESRTFVSFTDGILFAKYESDEPFDAVISYSRDNCDIGYSETSIEMKGKFEKSLAYALAASVTHIGGTASAEIDGIHLSAVASFEVRLDVRTTYVRPDRYGLPKPSDDCSIPLAQAKNALSAEISFDDAFAASSEVLAEMMNRVQLRLDSANRAKDALPTDRRLRLMQAGESDTSLLETYFAYGRYLLICSSYKCTLPANLQGIWADEYFPAWSADYHIDINLQMNYWLAETCGLPELTDTYFDYLRFISGHGKRSAQVHYKMNGWVAHTITNPWGFTAAGEGASWGAFVCAGAWCCQHIIDRYEFSLDRDFLRENYDILKGACEFFLDYLVTDPRNGYLVTCPSNSPENHFTVPGAGNYAICAGPTMDNEILRDLFEGCANACDVLGVDADFAAVLREKLAHFAPIKVGKHGQIMEWSEDFDEPEPGHRHISHLYALHPSMQILRSRPELKDACRKTLERRLASGGGHTGWSRAWITNFFARLGDGDSALDNLNALLAKSTLPNLFDNHPPFQIDGNFGGSAAFCEMLIIGDGENITLLPALPSDAEWQSGEFKGLRVRGNIEADCRWIDGKIVSCTLRSHRNETAAVNLRYNGEEIRAEIEAGGVFTL